MKKRISTVLCVITITCLTSWAQQAYPQDLIHEDQWLTEVSFNGASPGIVELATAYFDNDVMPELLGDARDALHHYLRHEPQEKGVDLLVDKKNGYMCYTMDYSLVYDDTPDSKECVEMCYWNCADGKHKIMAMSCRSMTEGNYIETEFSGISMYIYDNDTHMLGEANEMDLGVEDYTGTDEDFDEIDGNFLVHDRDTGQPLKLNREQFERWQAERPKIVYFLPREGKDITTEIYFVNRVKQAKLAWDGMYFNIQD